MVVRPPLLVLLVALLPAVAARGETWTTDLKAARAQAADQGKDLLLSFTGSDWCPDCIRLKNDILVTGEFRKAMAPHFVLVELDFPRDQAGIPAARLSRNEKLLEDYSVVEFPTLVLADPDARPYALTTLTTHRPAGAGDYVQHLLELKQRRKVRDEALKEAEHLDGLPKARALVTAIADYPDCTVAAFYRPVVEAILEADPEDRTGFQEAREYRLARSTYEKQVATLLETGEFEATVAAADAFVARHDPTGVERQKVLLPKLMATVETGSRDDCLKLLEDIRTIAPDSEVGLEATRLRSRIEAFFAKQGPAPTRPADGQRDQPPG